MWTRMRQSGEIRAKTHSQDSQGAVFKGNNLERGRRVLSGQISVPIKIGFHEPEALSAERPFSNCSCTPKPDHSTGQGHHLSHTQYTDTILPKYTENVHGLTIL